MFPPMHVSRAMYHHCQDTGSNCGRTCAQMIVSSFTQSPGPGDTFPAPSASTALPVEQEELRLREAESSDTVATPQWFTHPEEMFALLKSAPEFTKPFQKLWRLANHSSREGLMADVLQALQRGMPSIIGVYPTDHWVVVTGAFFDASGNLDVLRMLNPLPTRLLPHTYKDECSNLLNGESYGPWELFDTDLGSYSLEVGTVPPSAGMKSFAGRFVGIIQGVKPPRGELERLRKRIPAKRARQEPGERVLDVGRLIRDLKRRAAAVGIRELDRLLEDGPTPVQRVVKDIDGSPSQYTLVSLFSQHLKYGLIAAFEAGGLLMHFQFTNDDAIDRSLRGDVKEPLWWTRQWLPSLPSPYFPFTRKLEQFQVVYARSIDGYGFNTDVPRP